MNLFFIILANLRWYISDFLWGERKRERKEREKREKEGRERRERER